MMVEQRANLDFGRDDEPANDVIETVEGEGFVMIDPMAEEQATQAPDADLEMDERDAEGTDAINPEARPTHR